MSCRGAGRLVLPRTQCVGAAIPMAGPQMQHRARTQRELVFSASARMRFREEEISRTWVSSGSNSRLLAASAVQYGECVCSTQPASGRLAYTAPCSTTAVTFVLAFCASDSWSGCIGVRRRLDAVAKLNASPNGARSIFEGSEGLRADAWPQTDVPRPMLSVRRFAAASLTRMSQSARGVPRTVAPLIATTCRVMNLQRGRTVESAGGCGRVTAAAPTSENVAVYI